MPVLDCRGREVDIGTRVQFLRRGVVQDGLVEALGRTIASVRVRGHKHVCRVPFKELWRFDFRDYGLNYRKRIARSAK